ncbi:MAG: DUF6152 family protein [Rhodospirillaceae bacterium]|nr:DUF6152 family protein [Rhodospirillaceae bacterium]
MMKLLAYRYCGLVTALLAMLPLPSHAHHAFAGVFDMDNLTELEGEITRLMWRNPHVQFTVRTADGESWRVETNSVSILSRMDISPELLSEGDRVTVAGYSARNGDNEMWTNNVLLADGREVVTRPGVAPHWSEDHLGRSEVWLADGDAGGADQGIFRVWSTRFNGPGRYMGLDEYPLTAAAAAAREAFDPSVDDPTGECAPKGMPAIMHQPYPVAFTRDGNDILFLIEEYDLVRRIHMNPDAVGDDVSPTLLGHSTGRWDDDALVVDTHAIDWFHFNTTGIPQSSQARLQERFSLSGDGANLDYTITVTDPETFTEPVTMRKQWVWRAGETIEPFACTNY